eukprot:TRINITY_DN12478_c0_g1_i1.p1 TRINITY_DN12478_c0_g1~~TRINITY_DN12478_c0_g1_i1.p1  ORF type:complete len:204 (+),score=22.93 TRINITY_DN12478_c0_g1_i1:139-750(+)
MGGAVSRRGSGKRKGREGPSVFSEPVLVAVASFLPDVRDLRAVALGCKAFLRWLRDPPHGFVDSLRNDWQMHMGCWVVERASEVDQCCTTALLLSGSTRGIDAAWLGAVLQREARPVLEALCAGTVRFGPGCLLITFPEGCTEAISIPLTARMAPLPGADAVGAARLPCFVKASGGSEGTILRRPADLWDAEVCACLVEASSR